MPVYTPEQIDFKDFTYQIDHLRALQSGVFVTSNPGSIQDAFMSIAHLDALNSGLFNIKPYTNQRHIGGIIPHCAIQEDHNDSLQITQHPVESGATVADHAFLLPKTVDMKVAWSDSFHNSGDGISVLFYNQILGLQSSRTPLTVWAGKRIYSNMLIRSIDVTTDEHSEHACFMTVRLQEVRITSATSFNSGQNGGAVAASAGSTADRFNTSPQSVQGPIFMGPLDVNQLYSAYGWSGFDQRGDVPGQTGTNAPMPLADTGVLAPNNFSPITSTTDPTNPTANTPITFANGGVPMLQ